MGGTERVNRAWHVSLIYILSEQAPGKMLHEGWQIILAFEIPLAIWSTTCLLFVKVSNRKSCHVVLIFLYYKLPFFVFVGNKETVNRYVLGLISEGRSVQRDSLYFLTLKNIQVTHIVEYVVVCI